MATSHITCVMKHLLTQSRSLRSEWDKNVHQLWHGWMCILISDVEVEVEVRGIQHYMNIKLYKYK